MIHFFVPFAFLFLSLFSFKLLYLFARNPTNSFINCLPDLYFISPITFLFFPLGNGLSLSKFEMSIFFQHLLECLCKYHLFSHEQ